MYKSKILVGLVLMLYVVSVVLQFIGNHEESITFKSFILPVITLLYFLTVKKKALFFTFFLVIYSISDLGILIGPYLTHNVDYFLGNFLYILAYTCLIIEICKSVCVIHILRNFKIHMVVLTILNIYVIYVLQIIIDPLLAETSEYYVELIYNILLLLLLSVSLLNYFYRDNLKSLYLFLGSLSIVFAEVIWVAYAYISQRSLLNIISTSLFVLSFYFYYKQSKFFYEEKKEVNVLIN